MTAPGVDPSTPEARKHARNSSSFMSGTYARQLERSFNLCVNIEVTLAGLRMGSRLGSRCR